MITFWKDKNAPENPFYAVIFISQKSNEGEGYEEMNAKMMRMAADQMGYLGYSSASKPEGGIFISYWKDEASIQNWRENSHHKEAKSNVKSWYSYYHSMITRVESSAIFGEQLLSI